MTKLEKDILLIDKELILVYAHYSLSYDFAYQAFCEIQKFRFIRYRESVNYHNSFDIYLNDISMSYIDKIKMEVGSLTKHSDFITIEFYIELLMEYAWQTINFDFGYQICDELIRTFERCIGNNNNSDAVSLYFDSNIRSMRTCKLFFSFMRGDEIRNIDSELDQFELKDLYGEISNIDDNLDSELYGKTVYKTVNNWIRTKGQASREHYLPEYKTPLRKYMNI